MIKAVVKGILKLESPLLVSSGRDLYSDKDFVLDSSARPFIPGTSLAGALRSFSEKYFKDNSNLEKENLDLFWGTREVQKNNIENSNPSSIIISNCYIIDKNNVMLPVRDGVKIDSKVGIAEDKKKYNYQILEKDNKFIFYAEVKMQKECTDDYELIMSFLINVLSSGDFSIGAKTNNGFGKIKLEDAKYFKYDLGTNKLWDWLLDKELEKNDIEELRNKTLKYSLNTFKIKLDTKMDSSLIIGDSHPKEKAKKFHLKSNSKPILSGSSLKGAIRARAEKILGTIGKNPTDSIWENFFGTEGNPKEDKPAIKSRLSVSESFFENTNQELQSRIKIDRFTGGTIDGALFDSMPLFQNEKNSASVTFDINIRDFEYSNDKAAAGLLLLVLKDIWTGDLPIGGEKNVGRGRLRGVSATITWDDKKVVLKSKDNIDYSPDVVEGSWEELEGFVTALNDLVGKS